MAKWYAAAVAGTALAGLLALAGCQQQQTAMLIDSLPAPNFDGPAVAEAPAPTPALLVVPPQPVPVTPYKATPTLPTASGAPREWTPSARANGWRWIVIHHSATPTGGAAAFDRMHKAKGWDELGYHFVVGNGTDTRDGLVEVGSRWPRQKWGAHAKTPDNRYNDFGIGVCLVGNFDASRPSAEQMKSVSRLVAHLMKTYHIPADRVMGHGDTKPTDCPGRLMNVAHLRKLSTQILADAGDAIPAAAHTATAANDLLFDIRSK